MLQWTASCLTTAQTRIVRCCPGRHCEAHRSPRQRARRCRLRAGLVRVVGGLGAQQRGELCLEQDHWSSAGWGQWASIGL